MWALEPTGNRWARRARERHWLVLLVQPRRAPPGRWLQLAFGSTKAWTQAPWAGGEVVLWTVFPVGMWPIRPSPGTKPMGPNESPLEGAADSATPLESCTW